MDGNLYYTLDDNHEVIPTNDVIKWARFFENTEGRTVAKDEADGMMVSTVFLGLDHGFGKSTLPIVFETMVFDKGREERGQERYDTWEAAEAGHRRWVKKVFGI